MTCDICKGTGLDGGDACERCNGDLEARCYWGDGELADRPAPHREHEDGPIVMVPMCEQCASIADEQHARQQRQDDAEAHGDWLRDQAKDDRR